MDIETFKRAVKIVRRIYDYPSIYNSLDWFHFVNLTGGEPLLHPLFFDFVEIARDDGLIVGVVSNGMCTDRALKLADLADSKKIVACISRDSFHEPIDPRVVKRFAENKTVYRRIHGAGNLSSMGRTKQNGLEAYERKCVFPRLFVDVDGRIWFCGHREKSFGDVYHFNIPNDYIQTMKRFDQMCSRSPRPDGAYIDYREHL